MAGVRGINGKKVRQLDYNTDEELDIYDSIEDAAYDNFTTRKTINYALDKNGGKVHKLFLKFEMIS